MARVARVLAMGTPSKSQCQEFRAGWQGGRAFMAAEPHRLGNWHVHGLFRLPGCADTAIDTVKADFKRLGWSRVESVRNYGAVSSYCSKYLTKDRMCDWDLYGDWFHH